MVEIPAPTAFFVAGGTVPPDSPSYVERAADRELYEVLLTGEFCTVLNSRQMGKSSLAVRTISKLTDSGVRTAFVDLTRLGSATVTPEQWYAGLLMETGRALGLRSEAAAYLKETRDVGPAQRFLGFLQEVALTRVDGPIVTMIDEIDAVRSLDFSTDELFAGLRQLHNGRASDPALRRLTICLLGAALPSDLIRDPRVTPFNVGRRIELRDFTPEEAEPFAEALGGEPILARLLEWTGGHPFLTQALGAEIAGGRRDVDALVRERYLDARARETDTNLTDVGRRLLGAGDPSVTDEERATTLALYDRMLKGGHAPDDEANPSAARIKMSGVARVERGLLKPRNRIYAEAFDRRWARDNTPGQELRRQRKAFWRGALRTGFVSAAVIAVVGGLAWNNLRLAREARRQRDAARYEAYVASMQTMAQHDAEGDLAGIRRTLAHLRDDPSRGWEWTYWNRAVDHGAKRLDWEGRTICREAASPRSTFIPVTDYDSLTVYEVATGRRLRRVPLGHALGAPWAPQLFRDGRRALISSESGDRLRVVDLVTGQTLCRRDFAAPMAYPFLSPDDWSSRDDRFTVVASLDVKPGARLRLSRLDLDTLRTTPTQAGDAGWFPDLGRAVFGGQGRAVAWTEFHPRRGSVVTIRRAEDMKEIRRIPVPAATVLLAFDPQGSEIAVRDGRALVRLSVATGKPIGTIPGSGTANQAVYSPEGDRLLVSAGGIKAEEYALGPSGTRLLRTFPGALGAFYLPGGRLFLDADPDLMVLPPSQTESPSETRLPGGPYWGVGQSADGEILLAGSNHFLTIGRDRPLAAPSLGPLAPGMVDASGRFLTRLAEGRYEVVDRRHDRVLFWKPFPKGSSAAFAASPDGHRIAIATSSIGLEVVDATGGALIRSLGGMAGPTVARFSDDGRWLAVGDGEGSVSVWDAQNWRRAAKVRLVRDGVLCLAFSGDGTRVAAGSLGSLGALDLRDASIVRLPTSPQAVRTVAWSHDGRRLASAGEDRRVRLWDPATGRALGAIGSHQDRVIGVWFTRNDHTLCSVDVIGVLKLWMTEDRP